MDAELIAKQPPYSLEAEQAVLGSILIDSRCLPDIIEKVSRESTALIKKGFEFSSNSPSYIITDLDKYKMELLEEATINATNRAKVLAKNSNGKIGALVSASQGIFQITAPASSDISSYGEYDKSTIMKEVKAVVTLAFSVE